MDAIVNKRSTKPARERQNGIDRAIEIPEKISECKLGEQLVLFRPIQQLCAVDVVANLCRRRLQDLHVVAHVVDDRAQHAFVFLGVVAGQDNQVLDGLGEIVVGFRSQAG